MLIFAYNNDRMIYFPTNIFNTQYDEVFYLNTLQIKMYM